MLYSAEFRRWQGDIVLLRSNTLLSIVRTECGFRVQKISIDLFLDARVSERVLLVVTFHSAYHKDYRVTRRRY